MTLASSVIPIGMSGPVTVPHLKQHGLPANSTSIPRLSELCRPVARACRSPIPRVLVWKCRTSFARSTALGCWQGHHIRPQVHDQFPVRRFSCRMRGCPHTQIRRSGFLRPSCEATSSSFSGSRPSWWRVSSPPANEPSCGLCVLIIDSRLDPSSKVLVVHWEVIWCPKHNLGLVGDYERLTGPYDAR
jgi:hypothetical protein